MMLQRQTLGGDILRRGGRGRCYNGDRIRVLVLHSSSPRGCCIECDLLMKWRWGLGRDIRVRVWRYFPVLTTYVTERTDAFQRVDACGGRASECGDEMLRIRGRVFWQRLVDVRRRRLTSRRRWALWVLLAEVIALNKTVAMLAEVVPAGKTNDVIIWEVALTNQTQHVC